jgi:pimeloyl-ACP methyl ester carboxylesterase
MSAIIQEDAIIHYEVLGHGKPVIFLHSWIGSWRYWIPSMQFTSSRYRAYAIDFWGFGSTKKIASRYTLEQQVELLRGFIKQMGVGRTTLVGHGLGSIIGIYFAADFADLVERLMVISFPMGYQNAHPRLQSQSPVDSAAWLFGNHSINTESREDARKTDHMAITKSFDKFNEVNWRQLIKRLSVSSLWIYGKNDQAIFSPTDEELDSLPELSQFQLFNKSGHFPMLDEPGKFNRLLTDFVNLPPGEDPGSLEIKSLWKRRVR